mgnify:CR=1 FL=1
MNLRKTWNLPGGVGTGFQLEGMPEMGSGEFTDWFTEHTDQEELWEYILSILERGEDKDKEYQALIGWITEHEALFPQGVPGVYREGV